MITPKRLNDLFKSVQENASPSLWSAGVALTRTASTFLSLKQSDEECLITIKIPGQPVSPKVTLWPEDQDWDCNCGSQESPCSHVTAAVIAMKHGALSAPETVSNNSSSRDELGQLEYNFLRHPTGLRFERLVVLGASKRLLSVPLVSYKAGLQSGRLKGVDVVCSKEDFQVDQVLSNYHGESLDRRRLENLFEALNGDQKIFLDHQAVKVSNVRVLVHYEVLDEGEGYRFRRVPNPEVKETFSHGVVLCGDTLKLVAPTRLTPEERSLVEGLGTFWPREREHQFCTKVLPVFQKKVTVDVRSLKLPQSLELTPRIDVLLEQERGPHGLGLSILANVVYGSPILAQLDVNSHELRPVLGGALPLIQRNRDLERQLVNRLARELNLQPGRRILLHGFEAIHFTRKVKGWDVRGNGGDVFNPDLRMLEPHIELSQEKNYSLKVNFLSAGGTSNSSSADFATVFKAWQQNQDAVPLLDGSWARLPQDWLARYGKKVREFLSARDAVRGNEVPAYRLPELVRLCDDLGHQVPQNLEKLRTWLSNFNEIQDCPLPSDLCANLRSYQAKGVNWLHFLREAGMGAMLADDMGLGKTLQMLCALKGRSLIVAPTSVIFNWAQEIQKFRPSLKVAMHYGAQRKLDQVADVVLTSYGVMRLDQELLSAERWGTVVLDEAQTIKNPDSQVAKAAHALVGDFRVALSGTPVENRLDDLWSQFQFINPGLLGSRQDFLENYARPIGRGDSELAERLRVRIKPFILRRLKREVAPELPPRTEVVLHCELSSDERRLYETLLSATRKEVLAKLEENQGNIMKALELILRLRQAC